MGRCMFRDVVTLALANKIVKHGLVAIVRKKRWTVVGCRTVVVVLTVGTMNLGGSQDAKTQDDERPLG